MPDPLKHRVLDHLAVHSLRIADAPIYMLASGTMSRYYVDVKKTAHSGDVQRALSVILHDAVMEFSPDAVAGVALGGCHLASLAAIGFGIPRSVIYVRKEPKNHGTKNLIEGPYDSESAKGVKVVLVEDVTTTGGSSLKALNALEEAGYIVQCIVSVVDRREDKASFLGGTPFKALFTLEELERHLLSIQTI